MQFAGRLYSAWSLVRDRLRHRNLLIFLLFHLTTSAVLFVLSILSAETNAEASHFLRHIIQTANLSSIVFYNPDNGKFGDWKSAPALVVTGNDTISKKKEDGIVCNDDGKRCKAVGKGLHRHEDETDVKPTFAQPFRQTTYTSTTTMTTQESTITTRVLVVPTLTVISGEALRTEVMLNEQGRLMETFSATTTSLISSTTRSSSVISAASATATATATASSKALIEAEEEEEEESEDGSDGSDDSSINSSDSGDEEEEEEDKPKVLKVSKKDYINAWKRDIQLSTVQGPGNVVEVNIAHLSGSNGPDVQLTQQCAIHYGWAINSLDNLVREEAVLAAFFIWILGLAVVGLLNESIPHLIWTANGLRLSFKFWKNFESTTTTYCDGLNVLPMYLNKRIGFQSTVLGLTVITMVASGVLCWKIRDHFGWQTFQRIGASSKINKIYKLVLALSILLQLDAFVLVTFFALFLDQISRGPASYFMRDCKVFKAFYSILIVALLPWLKRFNIFLCLSVLTMGAWAVSFTNPMFRIIFSTWAFFTCMGSLAVGLTAITVILAIIRRMTFGKGLADFLYLEEVHERPNSGLLDEKPSMPVAMPRSDLPTFSTAFGPGPAPAPPPRQMFPPMPVYTTATRVASWNAGDDRRAL
ncbi:hypothetical protein I302_108336 [Kwoniella bestiolae CBS 10118]|uniref:Uncharacterized protein n=1 Tax=Kwoniella bestiolae CBS 10118 TaxID=1296100 RepID=A0AAJ8MD36_9TREE